MYHYYIAPKFVMITLAVLYFASIRLSRMSQSPLPRT